MCSEERLPSEAAINTQIWNEANSKAWTPPSALTNRVLSEIENEPRIWLGRAVDLMAFGDATRPISDVETWAKRQQAARAIFEASRNQKVQLIGNAGLQGDTSEPIPETYFDIARALGHVDQDDKSIENNNTIGPDLNNCEMIDFVEARTGNRQSWSKVRVDVPSFTKWLQEQLPEKPSIKEVITYKTGAPGRPTSMNLITQEFERRCEVGVTADTITQEAAALAAWLASTHPKATPVKPKTIKNQLAKAFRERATHAHK